MENDKNSLSNLINWQNDSKVLLIGQYLKSKWTFDLSEKDSKTVEVWFNQQGQVVKVQEPLNLD